MALTPEQLVEIERRARELRRLKNAKNRKKAKADKSARTKAIGKPAPEQRQPRVQEPAYLQWVRRQPCVICGAMERVEAAHVRAGYPSAGWAPTGMAQKPDDSRCVPLCASHHRDGPDAQHKANERAWWSVHGIDPPDLCRALRTAYEAGNDAQIVIRRFSPSKEPA